ncbi:MAG: hypothetical protein NWS20_02840, partial [Rickettsiaceae bacterium]|nr:hypothetical protein [Rickettsiaceae bacterium]MDP5020539.1 hypothetical protein [Rickettsiaceae bacterium]
MKKKSSLKKFLATASAFAVISGAATSASAATVNTTALAATLQAVGGVGIDNENAFNANDDLAIHAANVTVTTGEAIVFGGGGNTGIDAAGKAGATFVINHNVTYAQAADFGSANGGLAAITVNAGVANFQQAIAGDVTVNAGQLIVGTNILAGTGAGHLTVNGGTATVVGVAGNVLLANAGELTSTGDVTGIVIINTTNAGMNTLHNAGNTVTLTAG